MFTSDYINVNTNVNTNVITSVTTVVLSVVLQAVWAIALMGKFAFYNLFVSVWR